MNPSAIAGFRKNTRILRCSQLQCRKFGPKRDEHASTVLTSNKGFEEWGDVFRDDVMAARLIDRLVHHCHLVTIRGNSYRMRQHTELWQALHAPPEPDSASRRRRSARQEVPTA